MILWKLKWNYIDRRSGKKKPLTHYKHPVRSVGFGWLARNRIVDESMIFDSLSKPNDYTFQLIYSLPFFLIRTRTYRRIDFYYRFRKWVCPFMRSSSLTYPHPLSMRCFCSFDLTIRMKKRSKRTVVKIQQICVPLPFILFYFILFDYFSYYELIPLKMRKRMKIWAEKSDHGRNVFIGWKKWARVWVGNYKKVFACVRFNCGLKQPHQKHFNDCSCWMVYCA